jgi:HlyD family secretion protein
MQQQPDYPTLKSPRSPAQTEAAHHSVLNASLDPDGVNTPDSRIEAGRSRSWWLVSALLLTAVAGAGFLVLPGLLGRHQAHASAAAEADAGPAQGGVLSVNTVLPQRKMLLRTFEQPGSIRPWAQAELYAKTSGYLKHLAREPGSSVGNGPEKDIGSLVKAGEVLVEIDVPELVQEVAQRDSLLKQAEAELVHARANIATFEAAVTLQTKQLSRMKELADSRTVTREVVDEKQAEFTVASSKLAAAKADLLVKEARIRVARDELERARILAAYTRIQSPFNGVISYRGVDVGDFVQNATSGQTRPLLSILAVDKVKVVLQVPERDAVWVQAGTEATVRLDARPGWQFKGKVARVSPSLDMQSRTRPVEIDLDNTDHKLLPGMYGNVTLVLQKIDNAQAIPATAVYSRRGENFIIQVSDGVAQRQHVRIRYDDGKQLEVVKLIDKGEVLLDGTEELIVSNKGEIAVGQRVRCSRLAAR